MNGKYALALILALQVSMSLCQIPQPDQELVDKYETMKTTFFKRLLNAYGKMQAAATPYLQNMGENTQAQAVKDYVEELQTKPQFQTAVKVATGLAQEAAPLVDRARSAGLGLYGHYLRPKIGEPLDKAINHIKTYLDQYLPVAEE